MLSIIYQDYGRIVIDRNLGALGKNINQLITVIEILTNKKVGAPMKRIDEYGIQIADFATGIAFYIEPNGELYAHRNTFMLRFGV